MIMVIKYFLLIELLVQQVYSVNFTNIKFGLLIDSLDENKKRDFIGNQALAAFLMAVKELNNKSDGLYDDLLPYTNISIAVATEKKYDHYSHQKIQQPLALTKSFNNAGIDALVGAARDNETKYAAYLYNDYDILTASYGASSSELSWANIYNYVIRTIPSISYEGKELILLCNFKDFIIILLHFLFHFFSKLFFPLCFSLCFINIIFFIFIFIIIMIIFLYFF